MHFSYVHRFAGLTCHGIKWIVACTSYSPPPFDQWTIDETWSWNVYADCETIRTVSQHCQIKIRIESKYIFVFLWLLHIACGHFFFYVLYTHAHAHAYTVRRMPQLVENFSSLFSLASAHTHMHSQAHRPKFIQSGSMRFSTSTLYALYDTIVRFILFSSNSFGSRIRFICCFQIFVPSLASRILFLSMEAWPLAPSHRFNSI